MAAQNILSLGIDVSSFNEQKRETLQEFIKLFDDLSKYDGKVWNPIMGGGLTEFNNSIKETSRLLDEINGKYSNLAKSTNTQQAKSGIDQLSLSMKEYVKLEDQAAQIQAKLSALTSDQAKETTALKLQLSQTTKEILSQVKAENESAKAKDLDKIRSQEYRTEQKRVVESLRQLAAEQDKEEKRNIAAKKEKEKEATRQLVEQQKAELNISRQLEQSKARQSALADKAISDLGNLKSDYDKLTVTLIEQKSAYQNLALSHGVNSAEAKAALADYAATSGVIGDISKKLNEAEPHAFGLGKGLSTMYNRLRIIAYILPGIGVAGIFSLAGEAIMSAVESLGLFSNAELELIKRNGVLTKSYSELLDVLKNIQAVLNSETNEISFAGIEKSNIQELKDAVELTKAQSKSTRDQMIANQNLVRQQGLTANELFFSSGGSAKLEEYKNSLDIWRDKYKEAQEDQERIDAGQARQAGLDKDKVAARVTEAKNQIDYISKLYSEQKKIVEDNADYNTKVKAAQMELEQYDAEQRRKLILDNAKLNAETIKSYNSYILHDERSTQEEIVKALRSTFEAEKQINEAQKAYTLSRPDSRNANGELTTEAKNDINSANSNIAEARRSRNAAILNTEIQFYQRRIKALTDFNSNQLDEEAQSNLKISKNENRSLEERLVAYKKYIIDLQQIQELQKQRDLQKGKSSATDKKSSLTPEEQKSIYSNASTQEANIQADTQKQVYDIVFSSLEKQLKKIKEINQDSTLDNKERYNEELIALNSSLDKKTISYEIFQRKRQELDRKYNHLILQDQVDNDKADLYRLTNVNEEFLKAKENADKKVAEAKNNLDTAKLFGGDTLDAQRRYDAAVGEQEAANQALMDSDKEVGKTKEKLIDDEIKLNKDKYDLQKKADQEYYRYRVMIENALFELVKKTVDESYKYRIEKMEAEQQVKDEGYENEISSIEKSTLSAKDKAALDIQLNAQKQQSDKNAAAQEKKLKIDQAVLDRELNIAHILWNTEEAISKTYATFGALGTPLAIEQGILGAIEIATVLATPIPSFKTGVTNFSGGYARYGEDGAEVVKEPYKSPYLVLTETVSYLPKGTDIIPITKPEFEDKNTDTSWEQTKWLGKQISKSKKEIKNIFRPVINVDLGFEHYKNRILNG